MTGTRPNAYMPLFCGDYLADTGHLTAAEHGAYLLLIMHYWTSGKPLPDSDAMLSRIARMTAKEWGKSREIVASFFEIGDGLWRHKRIETELTRAAESYARRANAGSKGGRAKAELATARPPQGTNNELAMLEQCYETDVAMLQQCGSKPEPEPDSANAEQKVFRRSGGKDRDGKAAVEAEFEAFWREVPCKVGKGNARRAFCAARRKADLATIMAALRRHRDAMADRDPEFIPHPATWLNGERWLDETGPPSGRVIDWDKIRKVAGEA